MKNRFEEAMKENEPLGDSIQESFEASMDLAKEISLKGAANPGSITETEKNFYWLSLNSPFT